MTKLGTLYIVATPLGNLEDITLRALKILAEVQLIAAEDTRHSYHLLQHYNIATPLLSLHQYNERDRVKQILDKLQQGQSVALISDAGTPLISDPGYYLVQSVHQLGLAVVPIPGACAAIAALSVAGMATDRFIFEGFLPVKTTERRKRLEQVVKETRTLIYYEAPHRIIASLKDMATIFGKERYAVVARELTKLHEAILNGRLNELSEILQKNSQNVKGEFVIIVSGALPASKEMDPAMMRILQILMTQLPLKQAVILASEICRKNKNFIYDIALKQINK